MENNQDKLDDEFVKNFNIGYIFGKNFPYISEEFLKTNRPEVERNKEVDNFKPISGIVLGLEEFYIEKHRELNQTESRLEELKELRNNHDQQMDREL